MAVHGFAYLLTGKVDPPPIQLYRGAKSPRLPFKQAGALFVYLIALQVNKAVYLQNKHFLGTRFHAPTY